MGNASATFHAKYDDATGINKLVAALNTFGVPYDSKTTNADANWQFGHYKVHLVLESVRGGGFTGTDAYLTVDMPKGKAKFEDKLLTDIVKGHRLCEIKKSVPNHLSPIYFLMNLLNR